MSEDLQHNEQKKLTHDQVRADYAESKARMVRKLFALAYNMGFDKQETPAEQRMDRQRVCRNNLNKWLLSDKSTVRKTFDKMSHSELTKAVTQLTEVYKDFVKKL